MPKNESAIKGKQKGTLTDALSCRQKTDCVSVIRANSLAQNPFFCKKNASRICARTFVGLLKYYLKRRSYR